MNKEKKLGFCFFYLVLKGKRCSLLKYTQSDGFLVEIERTLTTAQNISELRAADLQVKMLLV